MPHLPVLLELKRARHQRAGMALPHDDLALAGQRLSGVFIQRRLGIEGVDVADAAAHEQRNDALCARLEMWFLRMVCVESVATTIAARVAFLVSRDARPRPLIPPPD